MADPKQDEGFRVVDRRLFTEEGELRKDAVEQERREAEAAANKAVSAPPAAKQPGTPRATTGAPAQDITAAPTEAHDEPSRAFKILIDFLTRNAAAMLGGMADPRTGQPFVDLEGAREVIDMLDALREKTRGNLAKSEEELLLEVAGSLKLTYMEISKAAAEAMARKAKGKA